MPAQMLRRLTGRERTARANRQLGAILAFVAGAVNAGGFLAVQRYTSHMTGIISSVADELVVGLPLAAAAGLVSLAAFIAGAMVTAILVNWARRRAMQGEYALPLMLEALLLLAFGLAGANLHRWTELLLPGIQIIDIDDEPLMCLAKPGSNTNLWGLPAPKSWVEEATNFAGVTVKKPPVEGSPMTAEKYLADKKPEAVAG